jgi:translation initiation factor 2 beta subunit (eIF-2beta)/eIF-5
MWPGRPPAGTPTLLTVCASCEKVRTILFLTGDRWYCTSCRTSGDAKPKLYPVS